MNEFNERLRACLVCRDLCGGDSVAVVGDLIEALVRGGILPPGARDPALQAVMRREQSMPTAIADGVAFPHARIDGVAPLVPVIGIHRQGVDFGAADGAPTRLFVLMLVAPPEARRYLQVLAAFARQLSLPEVRARLLDAADAEAVRAALQT